MLTWPATEVNLFLCWLDLSWVLSCLALLCWAKTSWADVTDSLFGTSNQDPRDRWKGLLLLPNVPNVPSPVSAWNQSKFWQILRENPFEKNANKPNFCFPLNLVPPFRASGKLLWSYPTCHRWLFSSWWVGKKRLCCRDKSDIKPGLSLFNFFTLQQWEKYVQINIHDIHRSRLILCYIFNIPCINSLWGVDAETG